MPESGYFQTNADFAELFFNPGFGELMLMLK
jgi:hypothetical protein